MVKAPDSSLDLEEDRTLGQHALLPTLSANLPDTYYILDALGARSQGSGRLRITTARTKASTDSVVATNSIQHNMILEIISETFANLDAETRGQQHASLRQPGDTSQTLSLYSPHTLYIIRGLTLLVFHNSTCDTIRWRLWHALRSYTSQNSLTVESSHFPGFGSPEGPHTECGIPYRSALWPVRTAEWLSVRAAPLE